MRSLTSMTLIYIDLTPAHWDTLPEFSRCMTWLIQMLLCRTENIFRRIISRHFGWIESQVETARWDRPQRTSSICLTILNLVIFMPRRPNPSIGWTVHLSGHTVWPIPPSTDNKKAAPFIVRRGRVDRPRMFGFVRGDLVWGKDPCPELQKMRKHLVNYQKLFSKPQFCLKVLRQFSFSDHYKLRSFSELNFHLF